MNLYGFVGNDGANKVDLLGLTSGPAAGYAAGQLSEALTKMSNVVTGRTNVSVLKSPPRGGPEFSRLGGLRRSAELRRPGRQQSGPGSTRRLVPGWHCAAGA